MERTYVMLKPDAVKRGLMGQIIERIERKGYTVTNMRMIRLSEDLLKEHYAHVADKPFFPEMVKYMTSAPVVAMIVEGEQVVSGVRRIMGATKVEDAQAGTIRGDFAMSTTENLIHGSDSQDNAEIEIKRFFGQE